MSQGFVNTLVTLNSPGTAITAASRTSMTAGTNSTAARFTVPGNAIKNIGDMIELDARGIISCAVTTPGTALFDLAYGATLGTALFSTGAMPLNIVARTSVLWRLNMRATCTQVGTASSWVWDGEWLSEAFVNTALQGSGAGPGPGGTRVPWSGTASGASNVVTSSGFNTTVSNILDLNFTQTVATGSVTLQQMSISLLTATGF
jgi:hypothetical protein